MASQFRPSAMGMDSVSELSLFTLDIVDTHDVSDYALILYCASTWAYMDTNGSALGTVTTYAEP